MTRTMYDAIYPSGIPADAAIVASYIDGKWPNYEQAVTLFPNAKHVSIAAIPGSDAMVADCEAGDFQPADTVPWVQAQRARGVDPTVYCSQLGMWPAVRQAFHVANVDEPWYWIANYSIAPTLALGFNVVAHQYKDAGPYDVSLVADYWPTIDGGNEMLDPNDPIVKQLLAGKGCQYSGTFYNDPAHPDSQFNIVALENKIIAMLGNSPSVPLTQDELRTILDTELAKQHTTVTP